MSDPFAGSDLPVNIDATYADTGSASAKVHQQHHDSVHYWRNTGITRLDTIEAAGVIDSDHSGAAIASAGLTSLTAIQTLNWPGTAVAAGDHILADFKFRARNNHASASVDITLDVRVGTTVLFDTVAIAFGRVAAPASAPYVAHLDLRVVDSDSFVACAEIYTAGQTVDTRMGGFNSNRALLGMRRVDAVDLTTAKDIEMRAMFATADVGWDITPFDSTLVLVKA